MPDDVRTHMGLAVRILRRRLDNRWTKDRFRHRLANRGFKDRFRHRWINRGVKDRFRHRLDNGGSKDRRTRTNDLTKLRCL